MRFANPESVTRPPDAASIPTVMLVGSAGGCGNPLAVKTCTPLWSTYIVPPTAARVIVSPVVNVNGSSAIVCAPPFGKRYNSV
jgi:hypothetical protein